MKININFDFIDAVLNVNEQFGPFKVIRNNKKRWIKYHLPIYLIIDSIFLKKVINIAPCLCLQFGYQIAGEIYYEHVYKRDIYKEKSIKDLKQLVYLLEQLYLNTNYDLLLNSQLYDKKYKIQVRDGLIKEEKYILVPTINYNGDIKNTSILQEHNLGSDDYVLSIGCYKKEFKLVYANN